VLLASNRVKCWGDNRGKRLGYDSYDAVGAKVTPDWAGYAAIKGDIVEIDDGGEAICVRLAAGDVQCWGDTYVAGGSGIQTMSFDVSHRFEATQLAVGHDHACVGFREPGFAQSPVFQCWGVSGHGRLGADYVLSHPLVVPSHDASYLRVAYETTLLSEALQVSAGVGGGCAILNDGNIRCWGRYGMFAYGDTEDVGDDELPAEMPSTTIW
jgi:hypothetical protein